MTQPALLIIDDDPVFQNSLRRMLQREYEIRAARSEDEAASQFAPPPDLILLDLRLNEQNPDDRAGLTLLETLRQQHPEIPILMVTGYGDVDVAVEAMRLGASDFIQKTGLKPNELRARIANALKSRHLTRRVAELEQELRRVDPRQIVGESQMIRNIRRIIEAVGQDGNVTVLIRGETGTGKELIARTIHAGGRRHAAPFVPVMLNALPPTMAEAELFGSEAGAFTDARERRIGYLEKAHGGILFLDEIDKADIAVQGKMLRFLEEREFQRLGSTVPIKVDAQILAATNTNLEALVEAGQFREDLYFRLKVHEIVLPPLRERAEDIPPLVAHFLELFREQGKRIYKIAPDALTMLQTFAWPGNIRQIRNTLESALFWADLHQHSQIEVDDLPADARLEQARPSNSQMPEFQENDFDLEEALGYVELLYVEQALRAARGRKTEAWRMLGLNDRWALRRRVKRLLEQYPQLAQEFTGLRTNFE